MYIYLIINFNYYNKKDNKFKESRYYIGAVKFFDRNKDFGFIASNNCNMPTTKYNQDFYVDMLILLINFDFKPKAKVKL